jgi:hypothetical protein
MTRNGPAAQSGCTTPYGRGSERVVARKRVVARRRGSATRLRPATS